MLPAQQTHQLQQRAALALPAGISALRGLNRLAQQTEKAAAIFRVQRRDLRRRAGSRGTLILRRRRIGRRIVEQQREGEVLPRPAAEQRVLGKPRRSFLISHEARHGAERLSLRRNARRKVHPRQAHRLQPPQQRKVQQTLAELAERQHQQRRRCSAPGGKARQKRKKQRQEHICGEIPAAAPRLFRRAERRDEQPPADMALHARPRAREGERLFRPAVGQCGEEQLAAPLTEDAAAVCPVPLMIRQEACAVCDPRMRLSDSRIQIRIEEKRFCLYTRGLHIDDTALHF